MTVIENIKGNLVENIKITQQGGINKDKKSFTFIKETSYLNKDEYYLILTGTNDEGGFSITNKNRVKSLGNNIENAKSIINDYNIRFDEKISQAEDFMFMLEILFKVRRLVLVSKKPIYFYNRRNNSAMNRYITNDLSKQVYFHTVFIQLLKENKLFGVVKYRYLSNRLRMYSTVLSNAVRAIKRTQGLDEMRQTQKTLENDVYLKQVSFKKLYNPLAIKFLMILLKHNHIKILYNIYSYKEQKRLRKFC